MATYKEIQKHVKQNFGYLPKSCWIAHAKEICGLNPKISSNRYDINKRVCPCPVNKIDDIKQAVDDILKNEGPSFIEIIIRKGIRADMPQLKFDLKETKKKLMKSLQPNKSDIHD